MIVKRTADDGSREWARGLRRVTRSRTDARNVYDRTSRWYRFVEEPFERRARTAGLDPVVREAVVAAGWGRRTGWLHNVEAGLAREVWIGRERFVPAYRVLAPDEAERLFADYERRNRLGAPLVRAVISRLVGWRYVGTQASRRRVVEQLSLVGFRPRASD